MPMTGVGFNVDFFFQSVKQRREADESANRRREKAAFLSGPR